MFRKMVYDYTILPITNPTNKNIMCLSTKINTKMFDYFYVCKYTDEKMRISRGFDNIIFVYIREI